MYALITGASSGIGEAIAIQLAQLGYNLIIVARREERLKALKEKLEKRYRIHVIIKPYDLSQVSNCYHLYEECKGYHVGILVNNAGFGKTGKSEEIPLEQELSMIYTNIMAPHILTKLFLKSMKKGKILNVASIAGFQPDPIMATYGATKSYVINFSRALNYELKKQHKKIHISTLCPGPVDTEFDFVANADVSLKYISAEQCAQIALIGLFQNKELIIPDIRIKMLYLASKLTPTKLLLPIEYMIQTRKKKR